MLHLSIVPLGNKNLKCHLAKNNGRLKYANFMILHVVAKRSQEASLWRNNYTGVFSHSLPLVLPTELFTSCVWKEGKVSLFSSSGFGRGQYHHFCSLCLITVRSRNYLLCPVLVNCIYDAESWHELLPEWVPTRKCGHLKTTPVHTAGKVNSAESTYAISFRCDGQHITRSVLS